MQPFSPIDEAQIRPGRWLYAVGILIFVIGAGGFVRNLLGGLSSTEMALQRVVVPSDSELNLEKTGGYTIFYERRSILDGKIYISEGLSGLTCELTPTGGGERIPLREPKVTSSYSFGSYEGNSVLVFEISAPGRHRLSCVRNDESEKRKGLLSVASDEDFNVARTVLLALGSAFGGLLLGGTTMALVIWLRKTSRDQLRQAAVSSSTSNTPGTSPIP